MLNALEDIRKAALEHGYLLRPVPPQARQTADDVAAGFNTSRKLASRHDLKIQAAHMRMRTAERFGLIQEDRQRTVSSGGWETVWMRTRDIARGAAG